MNQLITVLIAFALGTMSSPYIANAFERQAAAEHQRNVNHDAFNKGYFDGLDDEIYEASEQYQVAKDANEFLKVNRSDK